MALPTLSQSRRRAGMGAALLIWAVLLVAIAFTLVAARRWWLPGVASVQGAEVDRLFTILFGTIAVVFVLVQGALGWFVWRFTDRGGPGAAAYWHEDRRLELAWTLIPAAILVTFTVLAGSLWLRVHGAPPPGALTVQVVAEQFGWRFHYPGPDGRLGRTVLATARARNPVGLDREDPAATDDIISDVLYLPVGRPVHLLIQAKDVIHSFFVPSMRLKQDAVPGRVTHLVFTPTREGEYTIACTELCGVGHYVMRGSLNVVSTEAFQSWLQGQTS